MTPLLGSISRTTLLLVALLAVVLPAARADESLDTTEQQEPEETPLTAGFDGTHAFIRSKDGAFEMTFGGRMHLDYRAYSDEAKADEPAERATPPNSFVLRRARLEMEGSLYKDEEHPEKDLYFEFKVQAEFADQESTLLRDGYVNIHVRDDVQVMAGQFKAPFSQEELSSSRFIDFVERSMLNNLAPSRSPGVMVWGTAAKGIFQYAGSLQNDRGELGVNPTSGPDLFGRLRFRPFRSGPFEKLSFGGAYGVGKRENETLIIGRTSSRSAVFFSRVPLNGDLVRRNVEGAWYRKNVGIEAEYDDARAERLGLGDGGADLPDLDAKGFMVQGMYVLTGETKGDSGITPKRPLHAGGPGAWELAFRYERFEVDDSLNVSNLAQTYTVGVNWWLNKFLRYQSNFVFERFRRPPGNFADSSVFAYLTRLGIYF